MEVDAGFLFCGIVEETLEHVVMQCSAIQPIWFASSLSVRVASFPTLQDLMVTLLEANDDHLITQLQVWLYVMWEARNALVFNGKPLIVESLFM